MITKTLLSNALSFATENTFGFACWKTPNTPHYFVSISFNHPTQRKIELESEKPGFCLAPFDNTHLNQTLFFESDILYSINENELSPIIANEAFEVYCHSKITQSSPAYFSFDEIEDTQKEAYINTVSQAINQIKETSLQKVIVSKVKTQAITNELQLTEQFLSIAEQHPNAFVSLVTSPTTGTWLGASPEILVALKKNTIFKTVALAGTQQFNNDESLKEAVWSQKEIEEQAFVSRYIIDCFKKIRVREYDECGPRTVKAGNLLHLKTEFSIDLNEVIYPNLGSVMLELLHPTSAVCGMPKEAALDFIKNIENHKRSFYSGFLGPVNIENETELYVNLRCVQVLKDKLVFYAGAGITEDSNPEKEWIETEQKCNVLGKFFN